MSAARVLEYPYERIPALENGDVLDRAEFERRYKAMPDLKKAELINGVVYLGSPVYRDHYRSHLVASTWLGHYIAAHPDLEFGDNGSVILDDEDTEVQPDLFLRRSDGPSTLTEETAVSGPPEFVMEISSSSASRDLHMKLEAYERAGVREYVVWNVRDGEVLWFELDHGRFERRTPD
ncbi:MAG: Uma2 family endonuclease, partial [Dehalococcoidia bacterium]